MKDKTRNRLAPVLQRKQQEILRPSAALGAQNDDGR